MASNNRAAKSAMMTEEPGKNQWDALGKKSPESLDVKEEGGNWVRTTGWWAETQGTGRRSAPDHIP